MKLTSEQITKIVWLYTEENWHAADIAWHMGVHRATVYRALTNAGVPKRDDRRNALRKDLATHCGRGHEFTKDNTYWSNGSRTCKRCHETARVIREFMKEQDAAV